jgi:hypothetical protein
MPVIALPDRLERLATGIKMDLSNAAKSDAAWIDSMVAAAIKAAEARRELKDNISFGQWWAAHGLPLNAHDRAALAAMGENPEEMRQIFTETNRRSVRLIFEANRNRFGSATKTTRGRKKNPNTKPPKHMRRDENSLTAQIKEWGLAQYAQGNAPTEQSAAQAFGLPHGSKPAQLGFYEARGAWLEQTNPIIESEALPKTAQQKLEAALRRQTRRLDAEHAQRMAQVDEQVRLRVVEQGAQYRQTMETYRAEAERTERLYRRMIENRNHPFKPDQFIAILRCLHPDSVDADGERTVTRERLNEAFRLFNGKKLQLTGQE